MNLVLGIDPGLKGAFVLTDGVDFCQIFAMPLLKMKKETRVDFGKVLLYLQNLKKEFGEVPIFLERAKPLAMGSKFAFNYGRDFEKIIIAISFSKLWAKLVEPSAWTKEMHEGLDPDLKAKAKSMLAMKKLYPHMVARLPVRPRGKIDDGPVDAFLIAMYGLRMISEVYDFS